MSPRPRAPSSRSGVRGGPSEYRSATAGGAKTVPRIFSLIRTGHRRGELVPISDRGQGSAGEGSPSPWAEACISQKAGSLENTGLVSVFRPQKRLEPQREGGPAGRAGRALAGPGMQTLGCLQRKARASSDAHRGHPRPPRSRPAGPGDAILGRSGELAGGPAEGRGARVPAGPASWRGKGAASRVSLQKERSGAQREPTPRTTE